MPRNKRRENFISRRISRKLVVRAYLENLITSLEKVIEGKKRGDFFSTWQNYSLQDVRIYQNQKKKELENLNNNLKKLGYHE